MKKYRVTRKIMIEYYHEVEANSKKEAIDIAYEYGEFTNCGSDSGTHSVKAEILDKP